MSLALKLALCPLLIVQAARTRARALRLPEAAGPREGNAGEAHAAPLALLILGDSSAAGVGVARQRDALAGRLADALARTAARRVHWRLVARSGASTARLLPMWRDHGSPRADLAVVVSGVNDVTELVSTARALRERSALADSLEREAGVRQVVFAALPPMGAFTALPQPLRWLAGRDAAAHNRALERWATGHPARSFHRIELAHDPALLAADGYHPGPEVYRLWALSLADHLAALADFSTSPTNTDPRSAAT